MNIPPVFVLKSPRRGRVRQSQEAPGGSRGTTPRLALALAFVALLLLACCVPAAADDTTARDAAWLEKLRRSKEALE